MSTMGEQKPKDLENCVETYEEKGIQLLEDRRAGKLIYFASWYFFRGKWLWNIFLPFYCAASAACTWSGYFGLRNKYYNTEMSELFSFSWLTIHYLLAFVMLLIDYIEKRKNIIMEAKTFQKLLGEVSETDLVGDPVAWRRIAFNVNQCFAKKRFNSSIFYGGEQCRLFFLREVVTPVDSKSYDIRPRYNENIYKDFCKKPSNKKLAQKAVANYNKSVENHDESLRKDGAIECDNDLFEMLYNISVASVIYLTLLEMLLSSIMSLAMLALVTYRILST